MAYRIRFHEGGFTSAVTASHQAGTTMSATVSAVAQQMTSLAGTIGPGPAGDAMVAAVDGTAQDVLAAALTLGPAVQSFASLLDTARQNHLASDAASDLAGGPAPTGAGIVVGSCPTGHVPSSRGSAAAPPWWWHYLAPHLGGVVLPHVEVDVVSSVGCALRSSASDLLCQVDAARAGYAGLAQSDSPDVGTARDAAARLVCLGHDTAIALRNTGIVLVEHAEHVDAALADCDSIATQTITALQVVDIPGQGERLVTAGRWTTATVAHGAAAAEAALSAAAGRIRTRLQALANEAAADASTMASIGSVALDAAEALATYAQARPVQSVTSPVMQGGIAVPAPVVAQGVEEVLALAGITGVEWLDAMKEPHTVEMPVAPPWGAAMALGALGVLAKEAEDGRRSAADVEAELSDEDKENLAKIRAGVAAQIERGESPSAVAAAKAAGISQEARSRLKGLDAGAGRDTEGKMTGYDYISKGAEAQAIRDYATKTDNYVEVQQVRAVVRPGSRASERELHRYYDGIEVVGEDPENPGDYLGEGIEYKGGTARLSQNQRLVDRLVEEGREVIAKLPDGRIVRIIRTRILKG